MKTIVHALLLLAFCASVRADERTKTFLKQHCIRCHGDNKQKADRRFDTLPTAIKKLDDLERYQEIVDQLNLGNMPPEVDNRRRPAGCNDCVTGQLNSPG